MKSTRTTRQRLSFLRRSFLRRCSCLVRRQGTLTVALDALVISFWSYRKGHPSYKILFNLAAVAMALLGCFTYFLRCLSLHASISSRDNRSNRGLVVASLIFTVSLLCTKSLGSYLLLSRSERRASPIQIWRDNFLWIALNYFGGASVAAYSSATREYLDYSFLVIIVPLLVVLYFTFSTSMGRAEDAKNT